MKSKHVLFAIGLGLGLTIVLALFLARPAPVVRADPGTYYVRAGASGDCRSTATPCGSIQQAIDMATTPGDEVWVATGVYIEHLDIAHPLSLRGGWNTSFAVQDPATYPTTIDSDGVHCISATVGSGAALIEGLTIEDCRDGIHLYGGTVTVTGNVVRNASYQGIEVDGGQVLIEGNTITGIDREGIEIDAGTVTVRSNTISATVRNGILAEGGTALIEGNVVRSVTGTDYRGIVVTGTHTVSGNHVSIIDDHGIHVQGGSATILNNVVHDTGGDGIHADDLSIMGEMRGNTVYDTGSDGIDTRAQTSVLASNVVYASGKDGIHVDDASTAHVQGNVIFDANDDCVDAGGDTAFITGNLVYGCGESGIKAEAVGHTSIVGNRVYNADQDGKTEKAGIDLDDAGTFTVTNNVVADSNWASVFVETGAGPHSLLYHNTLVGSATGQQGTGINVAVTGVTITLVNNIVVSHSVGISTAGATLVMSHTLLWGNADNQISGTVILPGPPLFVDPGRQDYHLLPDSPAVDAGFDVGVLTDVDGDPRPGGDDPDIGADEFWRKTFLPIMMRDA